MTLTSTEHELDELCINTIRTLSIDAVQKANSGHPGAPMALAPLGYLLYTRIMRHNPANPEWFDRDRFVLSNGHASMLLYSLLYLSGYPLTLADIENFRQVGSPTAGHPERKYTPGIEATTGPLGQGISMAVGLALGSAMLAARLNSPGEELISHRIFAIASDGDMQEGVSSEASSLAGHLALGRLVVFYDDNKVQLAGPTSDSFSEDVGARYEAYGWHVQNLGEQTDLARIESATNDALDVADRPSLIILRTHIGYGSPNKQDSSKAHGSPLGEEEVRLTKLAYGWDPDAHFLVPKEALAHFRSATAGGGELEAQWDQRLARVRERDPQRAALLDLFARGELPTGWDAQLPRFDPAAKPVATRKASGEVIQWAARALPQLVGGSADLASSTLTDIEDSTPIRAGDYGGRNINFGVREHAMGAIVNGLTLHGFRALGATFLTFSDYMRGAVRLSALMKLPSIWVYTHDSIGLGEDGPTHQPIEQLAALRAIPRLRVLRPADANETALAWRFALRHQDGPSAFALSRQNLPILDPALIPDDAVERGAYVLREGAGGAGGGPAAIIIATGSEVSLALDAAAALAEQGIEARVVSMPCMDNFAEAEQAYRDAVLPPSVSVRVAVEAACPLGWDRWIGPSGRFVGMRTFGESGPAEEVYEHFQITAHHVAEQVRELLGEHSQERED